MNILYIATDVKFPHPNGGSRRVRETANIFKMNGHNVSVLVDKKPNQPSYENWRGIHIYRKKMINIGVCVRKIINLFTKPKKETPIDTSYTDFHNPKPDEEHTFKDDMVELYRNYLPIHKWVKNITAYPLIKKIIRKHRIDAIIERSSSYGAGSSFSKIYIVDFIDILYSRRVLRKADGILSYFTTSQIPSFVPRNKIKTVNTCVDPEEFCHYAPIPEYVEEFGVTKDDFVVMYTGGMYGWHGLDILIKAARILQNRNIKNVKFIIIGDGDIKEQLIYLKEDLDLGETVKFVDAKPMGEIPYCLSVADIGVSLNNGDSVGFKLMEYMSCSLPTIITDGLIIPYVGEDNKHFFVIESNNIHQLADKIIELSKKPELLEEVGLNAMGRILEKHKWEHHYDNIMDLIMEIRMKKHLW